MYIFKNAWKSIIRNKGRNILIGVIILVIACSSTIALAILNSSNKLIESYEKKYDVTATIGINRENMMKDFDPSSDDKDDLIDDFKNIGNLTLDQIKTYGDSSYVSSYYYTYSVGLDGSNVDPASTQKEEKSNNSNRPSMPGGMNMGAMKGASTTDFSLVGYSSESAMTDFINGSYTITDGEVSTEKNTCVINSELASLNELEVGDTIKLVNPSDEGSIYKLTITGVFTENSESDSMSMFSNSVNNIITTSETVSTIASSDEELDTKNSPTFILKDKDSVDSFEQELYKKGMNEKLSVTTNLDQVENATSTISNVKSFAVTFLIIVLIIGSVVLLVINAINIRERKYEIGVMRTIGMKKSTLALEFMFELIIVTIASLGIGAAVGASVSVPISNKLLSSEIESSEAESQNIGENFGHQNMNTSKINGINKIDEFKSLDATVDLKVLGELLGIGICITMLSSLASVVSIQRFSPLTILKERS